MTGFYRELICFVESVGAHVCRTAEFTVKNAAAAAKAVGLIAGRAFAPFAKEASGFLKKPAAKESLAGGVKNKKSIALKTAVNAAFPIASIALLVFTVNSVMTTDYGVAVEYDGEEIGIVSGEEVLGEAQCTVADRIKYYDTDGDYYLTASLAIKPLASNDSVMDEELLARELEDRISMKYDEVGAAENETDENADAYSLDSGKVKAYAVRVNGEMLGAVEDFSEIEDALEAIKQPYDNGEYTEIDFDKEVEYDLEEYVDPDEIVSEEQILKTLTGYESAPEYYEVQSGDNLWKIADEKGMTLEELSSCYATYNGEVVSDLENSVLRVGTLIKLDSEVPYLQVECRKEVTLSSEIAYETITIEDKTLPEGQVVVDTEGQNGEKRSRAIVTYREGTPIRKRTLESVTYAEPVSEIVRVGVGGAEAINYDVPEFITDGGSGDYYWPVDGGYISAHQGDGRGHKGIDIAAPYGTPIYAAASGKVIDAGTGWNSGYGNCLIIQNDDGNVTVYAHQSEMVAELDDYVEQGQLIGYVGSTGDSTGNHLHFEIRKDGKYYDPEDFVSQ